MKKLHIINLAKMGGVERLFLQYLQDDKDGNNEILSISGTIGPEILKELTGHKINYANRIFNAFKLRYPPFLRKYRLKKKIENAKADMIIVWDLVPGLITKPKRGKLVYYDHGCSWRYPKNHKTLRFFAMLDGVISASYASKRVMEQRFDLPCPVKVVINRIHTPAGINAGNKPLTQPVRLGSASRQVSLKGISVTLLMMQELVRRGVDATLDIAGKGPDQPAFEQLVSQFGLQDKVKFLGFQDQVADFFNHIHIYLSTPITEPFGLSCMEALYYGVPVIFPMVDGQPEAVPAETCGIGLIPSVSVEQHQQLTGIYVNFPYQVYDPLSDKLVEPKLLSHLDCADAVERLMLPETYQQMRANALHHSTTAFDYSGFKKEFDATLNAFLAIH